LNDVMPTAEQVAGWSLTLDGALGSLDCTWNGAGLTCQHTAKLDGPLAEGSGTTMLPDVGDGLDQSSVDERAGWFFPARLQDGSAIQPLTITFESIVGPTEVRGTSTARPD